MWARELGEWKMIDYVGREDRLMIKSGEVIVVKSFLLEEEEDAVE